MHETRGVLGPVERDDHATRLVGLRRGGFVGEHAELLMRQQAHVVLPGKADFLAEFERGALATERREDPADVLAPLRRIQ